MLFMLYVISSSVIKTTGIKNIILLSSDVIKRVYEYNIIMLIEYYVNRILYYNVNVIKIWIYGLINVQIVKLNIKILNLFCIKILNIFENMQSTIKNVTTMSSASTERRSSSRIKLMNMKKELSNSRISTLGNVNVKVITNECNICANSYTPKKRVKHTCYSCGYESCMECIHRFLLSSKKEPHCMNCNTIWTDEYFDSTLSIRFQYIYRNHLKDILYQQEMSMTSSVQPYIELYNTYIELEKTIQLQMKHISELFTQMESRHYNDNDNDNEIIIKDYLEKIKVLDSSVDENKVRLVELKIQMNQLTFDIIQPNRNINQKKYKNEIIKCPIEDCKGFVSVSSDNENNDNENNDNSVSECDTYIHECSICKNNICIRCMTSIECNGCDDKHICNENDIRSVEYMKKYSKPCPKCSTYISKVSGCDQMWCTNCNIGFSWDTLEIIVHTNSIHNPHYFEYLFSRNRRGGGGNGGDGIGNDNDTYEANGYRTYILCDMNDLNTIAFPNLYELRYMITHSNFYIKSMKKIYDLTYEDIDYVTNLYSTIGHCRDVILPELLKQISYNGMDIRAKHMLNLLNENKYKVILEKNRRKKKTYVELYEIYNSIVQQGTYYIILYYNLYKHMYENKDSDVIQFHDYGNQTHDDIVNEITQFNMYMISQLQRISTLYKTTIYTLSPSFIISHKLHRCTNYNIQINPTTQLYTIM